MYYILLIIMLFFTACQLPSFPNEEKQVLTFYDLNSFFEKEIKSLEEQELQVQKKINQNGQIEERLMTPKNWSEELQIFRDSDINKASWKHKYSLDSTLLENGLTLLHYKALDESLATQVLDIKLDNQSVHSIEIIKKTSSQIYESKQYLTYIPQKSYSIKTTQEVLLFDKNEYHIETQYIQL